MTMSMSMRVVPEKPWFIATAASTLIAAALLISAFIRTADRPLLCSLTTSSTASSTSLTSAILHYATSPITPQQSRAEISLSYAVLSARSPCNFLVFGLGHDSLMWHSFNLNGGRTLFLEEDPKWLSSVLKSSPFLSALAVRYPTHLSQADGLLKSWRSEPSCLPEHARLKGNRGCRLALADLEEEVYEREWDVIMIDAPRGYFDEAPGRMGAIYSAAVMARGRRKAGPTDVFLHDVDRRVERAFAMEFLCRKFLVGGTGRLWHFRIPAASDRRNETTTKEGVFC